MNQKYFLLAGAVAVALTLLSFQNCGTSVGFEESSSLSPDSASSVEPPTPSLPTPTATPKQTTQCSASDHRVLGANGLCVCDFSGGYYEVAGKCEQTTALADLCTPRPASCGSVALPSATYDFDFRSAYISSSTVNFSSVSSGMSFVGGSSPYLANESVCGVSRQVLNFQKGVGLRQISTGLLSADYTVAILFRFNFNSSQCSSSWARVFDNKNNTVDTGLYMYGSGNSRSLQYYNFSVGTNRTGSEYAWVTFTKRGTEIAGYVNRQLQWVNADSSRWSDLTPAKDMIFFKDDTRVPGEECEGAVARILVFNSALTKSQAECLAY